MSGRGSGSIHKQFDLGNNIIVRIHHGRQKFEMIADADEAYKAKKKLDEKKKKENKEELSLEDIKDAEIYLHNIFETLEVFEDVKKGERTDEESLQETFGTIDENEIAAYFLIRGEFNWTQEQRAEWSEKKRKKIITILARNCINPQSKKPHPPKRIEKAMEEARVNVDLNRTAEEQVEDVLKQIQVVIPIRMESLKMAVKVPAKYAAKAYNVVAQIAQIKESEWQNDGSWIGVVSLPAGLQMELLDGLNSLTHGRVQTKLLQN